LTPPSLDGYEPLVFLTPLTPTPEAALRDVRAARAEFRVAAAKVLGTLDRGYAERARSGLAVLLKDTDARVRLEALRALRGLSDPSLLPDVMAQVADPVAAVRAAALLTAEILGCSEDALVARVTPPDPALQIAALEALVARVGESPSPAVQKVAMQALSDDHEAVRATAAAALAVLDARQHLDALAARLNDTPRVRVSAALALADLADSRGVPTLIEELTRGSFEAAVALGSLGVEAAREPLAAAAARFFTPLLTKAAAGAALIRLGDPRGEDALRAVLRAFRPDGRPYAVVQVMQLKLAALRPELEALLVRPRGVDRMLLHDALAALSAGSAT
jgi:HEAT repeat protein